MRLRAPHTSPQPYLNDDYLLLNSERRADGIVLEALIRDQPQSDLIPKVVRGLLAHRTQGRWGNTQENVFILLALDRYFQTYEKATPDFVARVGWGMPSRRAAIQGRSTIDSKCMCRCLILRRRATRTQVS